MNAPSALAGAIAFLSCVILVPLVQRLSARYRLFDSPGPLKIHTRPTSRLGGIAIAISLSLAILHCSQRDPNEAPTFFVAFLIVWITGLADDLWRLSPVVRLAAQIAAGTILWFGGSRIPALGAGFGGYFGICLIVVIFVNAFNFCDGSDGVAAGIAAIISVTFLLQWHGSPFAFSAAVAWALTGACLGFLIFNFSPGSIFMGDSGSTTLGYISGFLALNSYRAHGSAPLAINVALLPAALPLIDAMFVILRRLRRNISPLNGDRFHIYDQWLARGWSARRVALACYGITGIFCLASWLASKCTYSCGCAISTMTVCGFLVLEWRLGALQIQKADNSIPESTAWRSPTLFGNTK
jgi:UDP-GlcNAc:undecaprenyl-phosphate GlcNAc-1-phosphate transferase